jgi:hypothetical protein
VQLQRLPCPIEAETRHCTRRKFFIGRRQQFIQVGMGNKPERSKAACIGATLVIENSEPNFRKGWEAAIRSSRLNDANAPEAAIQLRAAESALSIAALRHCAHIASVSTIGGRHFDQAWTILARK